MTVWVLFCAAVGFLIGGWAGAAWGIVIAIVVPIIISGLD